MSANPDQQSPQESEEMFPALTEATSAGILVIADDKIVYANPAVSSISGYPQEEWPGMSFADAVHPDDRGRVQRYLSAFLRGEPVPPRCELKLAMKSGEEKWADCSLATFRLNGRPAVLITLVDVTDRKAVETALKGSVDQAELYLDLMSHDVAYMDGMAKALVNHAIERLRSKGWLDDESRAVLEKSLEHLQYNIRLATNVRKLQKEKSGK